MSAESFVGTPALFEVWNSAGDGFEPFISKNYQIATGFILLVIGLILTGLFTLNRKFANLFFLAVPAATCFGFGSVYMMCGVGVYV